MRFLLVALLSQVAHAGPICTEIPAESPSTVESIAFSADGRQVATTSKAETRVGRWRLDVAGGKALPEKTYSIPVDSVTLLAVSGNAKFAIGSDLEQNLVLHDLEKSIPGRVFKDGLTKPDNSGVISSQVVMTPDAQRLLSSHEDGQVLLWDTASPAKPLGRFLQKEPGALAISSDGRRALVATTDRHGLVLWDLKDPAKPVARTLFNASPNAIEDVAFAADGKTMAFRDGTGQVKVWDLDTLRLKATLKWERARKNGPPPLGAGFGQVDRIGEGRLALSPDGHRVAIVDPESHVALWDVTTQKMTRLEQPPIARSVAFSSDGAWLAAGGVGTFCVHRATPALANAEKPVKAERRTKPADTTH